MRSGAGRATGPLRRRPAARPRPAPHAVSESGRIFPGLGDRKVLQTAALKPVGETRVEETLFELGDIDSDGHIADMKMTVWGEAGTQKILVGEFSFETLFHRYGKLHPHPKLRSERFYRLWQQETEAWFDLGTTKTALVYGIAGLKPRHAA